MGKAEKILPKTPTKPSQKIEIPISRKDHHRAVDLIFDADGALPRAAGEVLLLVLWTLKVRDEATQNALAGELTSLLEAWASKGGAA